MNAPICHGAGIAHGPPNDRVREIEYVDANGNVQSVSDPAKLKAAAAAFGLLGKPISFISVVIGTVTNLIFRSRHTLDF